MRGVRDETGVALADAEISLACLAALELEGIRLEYLSR